MRAKFALSLLAGLALCSMPLANAAFANSWHPPYIHDDSNGDYTNYSYDDGICEYRYSFNSYEKHAQASRYGDCSHLAIGPDGRVMQSLDEPDDQD
jgi:hypothetical protein